MRDDKIDGAKAAVLRFLEENTQNIFYERQLSVIFERDYFHWITAKALFELVRDGSIESNTLELAPSVPIRFFRMRANRYWKRQAREIITLVRRFSNTEFAHALGHQGELLVDAALPMAGFTQVARNARSFKSTTWQQSGHDLDRIVQREGIAYGVEIKNTLPYIPRDEFEAKLSMCRHLGLLPLFVCRMSPKSYSFEIIEAGGISWVLGTQFYPFGHQELADAVRTRLRLPVAAPARIEDGAISRLIKAIDHQARRRHP